MKEIKTLAEALARIEALEGDNTKLQADLAQAKADLHAEREAHQATVEKLLKEEADHRATAFDRDHCKADAAEIAKLHADIGIKADAEAKTNSAALTAHIKKLASAEAAQICAAQGADGGVPTGGATGDSMQHPASSAKQTPAAIFQAQVDRLKSR